MFKIYSKLLLVLIVSISVSCKSSNKEIVNERVLADTTFDQKLYSQHYIDSINDSFLNRNNYLIERLKIEELKIRRDTVFIGNEQKIKNLQEVIKHQNKMIDDLKRKLNKI